MGGRTRKWEVFPGRSRFHCGGRCVSGGRCGALGVTLALLLGTAALHFAFTAPFLARAVSPWVPLAGGALAAVTIAALLRTALSDPGVLPRASPSELAAAPVASRPPPRAREVLVRGRLVKLKYCFTCKVFRPPRASHCSLCDNCVERFDHHCPWVGNCVGRRNYRHFYQFVVSLSFLCVWVCACGCAHVALAARAAGGLGSALRQEPASALAAAVAFLAVWSVLGLAGFHTYLAATEQTTNEDIKGAWSGGRSPYSRGSACSNYWHVLCAPHPPSLIDSRGFVSADGLDEELPPLFRAALAADLAAAAAASLAPYSPLPPLSPLSPGEPLPALSPQAPQAPYLISAPLYSMSGSPYAVRSPLGAVTCQPAVTSHSPHAVTSHSPHAVTSHSPHAVTSHSPHAVTSHSPHAVTSHSPHAVTSHSPHAVTSLSPHAYMNHSLDLDSLPLQEVCVSSPRDVTAPGNGHAAPPPDTHSDTTPTGGGGGGGGAAWRRLLTRTTMIDAALDLDELPPAHTHAHRFQINANFGQVVQQT